jgi:hypothetical protein
MSTTDSDKLVSIIQPSETQNPQSNDSVSALRLKSCHDIKAFRRYILQGRVNSQNFKWKLLVLLRDSEVLVLPRLCGKGYEFVQ